MQYTVRNIPTEVDHGLRQRAEAEHKSLNTLLVEALASYAGVSAPTRVLRDLPAIFDGEPLEPEVLQALEEQRQIDPEMWD